MTPENGVSRPLRDFFYSLVRLLQEPLMDHLNPQVRQVHERLGLSMFIVQSIERQLATLLVCAHEDPEKLTESTYDDLLRRLSDQSFGALVARLRKSVELPAGFDVRLQAVRKIRNWIAHHYFWDRAKHFTSPGGRLLMIRELDQISDELNDLDEYFDRLLVGLLQQPILNVAEHMRSLTEEA